LGKRSFGLTGSALALVLLSVGCGDDGDDGAPIRNDGGGDTPDAIAPAPDGGTLDSGGPVTTDTGVTLPSDSGATDASGDAGGSTGQFSGACFHTFNELMQRTDAGIQSDAGMGELSAALTVGGTEPSVRRAEVLFPLFCSNAIICDPMETMGQQFCIDGYLESFKSGVTDGFDANCLDKTLDAIACNAAAKGCTCLDECAGLEEAADTACAAFD
jgi:hypothetical protein